MKAPDQRPAASPQKDALKISVSFVVLFVLYHAAEYMIVFKNQAAGFLGLQAAFFIAALLLGLWYRGNGLTAWGLPFTKKVFQLLITGVLLGVALYAVPYFIALALGVEKIVKVPDGAAMLTTTLPFAFGVLFSSFSEDVLTRGLVYAYFHKKLPVYGLVLLSAAVYLLNHIYRLGDGPEALLYLFLLGVVFIIPVVFTKSLWLTGGMHWAGNVFFFVSHNVIQTEAGTGVLSANYLFALCLALFIPLIWLLCKRTAAPAQLQMG